MLASQSTTASPPAAGLPSAAQLQDAEKALRSMQRMLLNMGKDERRDSAEFKRVMAAYKHLGANLHLLRGKVQEQHRQEMQVKAQLAQKAKLQQAGQINQPRAAYKPPQAVAGQSLLTKVKQLQVDRGVQPAAPVIAPRAVAAAYGRPPQPVARPAAPVATQAQDAAGAMLRARVAYQSPQVMAGGLMVSKLKELGEEHPESVIEASDIVAPQAPEPAAPPAVAPPPLLAPRQAQALPEGFPLAMPRFVSTLGLGSSRAINKGPEVVRLQQLLAALGMDVPATEIFDAKTFHAVSDFQKLRCISVNGMVGLETRKLLNELVTG